MFDVPQLLGLFISVTYNSNNNNNNKKINLYGANSTQGFQMRRTNGNYITVTRPDIFRIVMLSLFREAQFNYLPNLLLFQNMNLNCADNYDVVEIKVK